ncbi:MAG: hypothetical protein ACK4LQ_03050 [Pararhodobacter sp.]
MTDQPMSYGGAFHVPEIDDDTLGIETDAAARALTEPGLPKHAAAAHWRNLLQMGLIHPYSRRRAGRRAWLFRADQVVIAAVLHRLGEIGLENPGLRQAVSLALNTWRADDIGRTEDDIQSGAPFPDVPRSPAMFAMVEYLRGARNLAFEVRTLRCQKSGQIAYACRVTNAEGHGSRFAPQPDSYVIRSSLLIGLDDLLAHICRAKHTHQPTSGVAN